MVLKINADNGQTFWVPLTSPAGVVHLPPIAPLDSPTGCLEIVTTAKLFSNEHDGDPCRHLAVSDPAEVTRLLAVLDGLAARPSRFVPLDSDDPASAKWFINPAMLVEVNQEPGGDVEHRFIGDSGDPRAIDGDAGARLIAAARALAGGRAGSAASITSHVTDADVAEVERVTG